MTTIDIELGLSEEDRAVRDMAHKFAEEVLRPAGAELDRSARPSISSNLRSSNLSADIHILSKARSQYPL